MMKETQIALHKTLENLEKALAEVRCQPCLWCIVAIHVEHLYENGCSLLRCRFFAKSYSAMLCTSHLEVYLKAKWLLSIQVNVMGKGPGISHSNLYLDWLIVLNDSFKNWPNKGN